MTRGSSEIRETLDFDMPTLLYVDKSDGLLEGRERCRMTPKEVTNPQTIPSKACHLHGYPPLVSPAPLHPNQIGPNFSHYYFSTPQQLPPTLSHYSNSYQT